MDRMADQPQAAAGQPTPRRLPRYVADHLGQVLRNRLRDTLFMPIPGEMTRFIEALPQDIDAAPDEVDSVASHGDARAAERA